MKKPPEIIIKKGFAVKSRQWWTTMVEEATKATKKELNNVNHRALLSKCTYSLLITGNNEIKKFNKDFRKINKATDVLSFQLPTQEQKSDKYLGDIVISTEYIKKKYKLKKDVESELKLLVVHAILHLLGYDHMNKKDEKIMFSLQDKIVSKMP